MWEEAFSLGEAKDFEGQVAWDTTKIIQNPFVGFLVLRHPFWSFSRHRSLNTRKKSTRQHTQKYQVSICFDV